MKKELTEYIERLGSSVVSGLPGEVPYTHLIAGWSTKITICTLLSVLYIKNCRRAVTKREDVVRGGQWLMDNAPQLCHRVRKGR